MAKLPTYMKPGMRSVVGSGVDRSSVPKTPEKLGELTPPGFVSYPQGAAEVSYSQGASTPASAGFNTAQVGMVPLAETED